MKNATMFPSHKASTVLMLSIFIATWINPIWPIEQALHSSLTLIGFVALWWHARKHPISDRDFLLIAIFICIHCIAARWLYSNIPYDQWLQSALGFSLNQQLGCSRNHFDRLVHFLYGWCFTPAIAAYASARLQQSPRIGFYVALSAIMISSLCYEWFEWLIAITLSAQNAEAYNGQQGDMWDAHKDMLLATLGSLIWIKTYRAEQTEPCRSPSIQPHN